MFNRMQCWENRCGMGSAWQVKFSRAGARLLGPLRQVHLAVGPHGDPTHLHTLHFTTVPRIKGLEYWPGQVGSLMVSDLTTLQGHSVPLSDHLKIIACL